MLYEGPWVAERLVGVAKLIDENPEAIQDVVRNIILGGKGTSALSAYKSFYRLAELCRDAEAEWAQMDAMLLPTAGTTYRIAEMLAEPVRLNSNLGAYTNFVNLMDLSALTVPAGFRSDALPFGVTVIGRAFEDEIFQQYAWRYLSITVDHSCGRSCTKQEDRIGGHWRASFRAAIKQSAYRTQCGAARDGTHCHGLSAFMRLPARCRQSPAFCSTVAASEISRWRFGKWMKPRLAHWSALIPFPLRNWHGNSSGRAPS